MGEISCPHCGASNPVGSVFCASCGKAMPVASAGPQVASVGTTTAGRQLVNDDLQKTMKKAFTALVVVAVLQTIGGPVLLLVQKSTMESQHPGQQFIIPPSSYAIIFAIAAVFWALAIWARRSPLPAAIAGLVVFVTLHLIDAVADPSTIYQGLLVKILVIAMLVGAINAGIQYRKLQTLAD